MIEISSGRDVERFIERAIARNDRLADVSLCAPFIDDRLLPRLIKLAVTARRTRCGLLLVTSRASATALLARLPGPPAFWRRTIVSNDRVHAKAYVATPRDRGHAEAIVTSANLTWGGVIGNVELGVIASTSTPHGRRIVRAVHEFIGRTAAQTRSEKK
jgi:hypothetical protein